MSDVEFSPIILEHIPAIDYGPHGFKMFDNWDDFHKAVSIIKKKKGKKNG